MATRRRSRDDDRYIVMNMPPIERRSVIESGMSRKTTRLDVVVVMGFFLALIGLLLVFAAPAVATFIHHIGDLVTNTGR